MGKLDLAVAILSGKGQISKKDDIWQWICSASSDPNTRNIVEIGTFNGGGSSKAIISGLRSNLGAQAVGLETDWLLHKLSDIRLRIRSENRFRVMRGSLVDVNAIDEVNLSQTEAIWVLKDKKTLSRIRQVDSSELPLDVDLLVSDGGEFTGWADFKALENKLRRHVILDDTSTRKNRAVFDYLSGSQEYSLAASSLERNGTAWFTRA